MKVLYIGVFNQKHVSDHYRLRGFRNAGIETYAIDFRTTINNMGTKSFEKLLGDKLLSFQPDLVLVNKGELIEPGSIETLKKLSPAKWFLFFGDKRVEIPEYIRRVLDFYDAILLNSDDGREKQVYKELGAKQIFYSHTATDTDVFKRYDIEPAYDLIFFGGNYENRFPDSLRREKYVNSLVRDGYNIKIFGNGWSQKNGLVFGKNFAWEASRAKIILGFQNFIDIELYTSNRTFNCMACGMYLTTSWLGCDSLFKSDYHLVYFDTYDELKRQIDYYLEHDAIRKKIFQNGRELIGRKHTYTVRAEALKRIYEYIN